MGLFWMAAGPDQDGADGERGLRRRAKAGQLDRLPQKPAIRGGCHALGGSWRPGHGGTVMLSSRVPVSDSMRRALSWRAGKALVPEIRAEPS
jgi:hypothetical protein